MNNMNNMNMFQLFYPSLGSSYTPNLSMDNRIAKFDNRFNNRNIEEEKLLRQISNILNAPYTYIFNSKLIKNIAESIPDVVLILSLKMQFPNKINNLDLTISTIKQLDPTLTPSWEYNKRTNTLEFSLDPVYGLNNISLNVNIIMDDGNTHIYNASYYGVPVDPPPPPEGPH